jgi:single-stranded DNA-specific DHH superfamily exonuclease
VSGLAGKTIDSYHISFMVAPRVNAAGRMSTPDLATRLLLASDETLGDEARELAQRLDGENIRRQEEEAEILAAAKKVVQTDPAIGARSVLVVAGEGWHRGVIGIVASKLVDAFHRPAIVLSVADGVAHGSCRSIPDFDMLAALERCSSLFIRFGGHQQAAGLTLERRGQDCGTRQRSRRRTLGRTTHAAPADRQRLTFGILPARRRGLLTGPLRGRQPPAVSPRAASRSSTARASSRSGT